MGRQAAGPICRHLFKNIISRHMTSALPMAIVRNVRNCTAASRKCIHTIPDARSNTNGVRLSRAANQAQPANVVAMWVRSIAQSPKPPRRRPVTHDVRGLRPLANFLRVRLQLPPTWTTLLRHSPGQLPRLHSAGLLQWRVTGSTLLHHTDCLFAGTTDLASTAGSSHDSPCLIDFTRRG